MPTPSVGLGKTEKAKLKENKLIDKVLLHNNKNLHDVIDLPLKKKETHI